MSGFGFLFTVKDFDNPDSHENHIVGADGQPTRGGERIFIIRMSGSGKSQLAAHYAKEHDRYRCSTSLDRRTDSNASITVIDQCEDIRESKGPIEALQSEPQKLLELIEHLGSQEVNSASQLAQVAVFGVQSAGKSSVLEALTQIPFFRFWKPKSNSRFYKYENNPSAVQWSSQSNATIENFNLFGKETEAKEVKDSQLIAVKNFIEHSQSYGRECEALRSLDPRRYSGTLNSTCFPWHEISCTYCSLRLAGMVFNAYILGNYNTSQALPESRDHGYEVPPRMETLIDIIFDRLQNPPPELFLLAVVGFVAFGSRYYGLSPDNKYKDRGILGAILVGVTVGILYGVEFRVFMLSILPWMLTCSLVLSNIIHCFMGNVDRSQTESFGTDVEKA